MTVVFGIIYWLLRLYVVVLIGRILVEMIQAFSRNFRAPRWFILISEVLFVLTDPPVKALRKVIPPLQMGQVALDLSVLVLFFILQVVLIIVQLSIM